MKQSYKHNADASIEESTWGKNKWGKYKVSKTSFLEVGQKMME